MPEKIDAQAINPLFSWHWPGLGPNQVIPARRGS